MEAIQFESKIVCTAKHDQVLKNAVIVIAGSFLLALAAQITVPFYPVPITLQSFAALFIGMAFGPRIGGQIIFVYLCEGIIGMPVFSNFSYGPQVLFGLRGGYLFGFLPATILTGYLLQIGWARNRFTIFLAALVGTIALFIPGYFVLAKFVGFHNAYLLGIVPFYLVEGCKLFFFSIITPFFWRQKN